jgi:hypothetical protein
MRALGRLLEYIGSHRDVWWTTMDDVATYWHEAYPPAAPEAGSGARTA